MTRGTDGNRGARAGHDASTEPARSRTPGKRRPPEAPPDVAGEPGDLEATRAVFAALPSAAARLAAARFLAAGIREADAVAPDSWVPTVRDAVVRLNVGQVAVLTILPEEISFAITSRPRGLAFAGGVTRAPWGPSPAFLSAARGCEIVCAAPAALASSLPRWGEPFLAFVRAAAAAKRGSPFRHAFREGVLRYLETQLGEALPSALGVAAGRERAAVSNRSSEDYFEGAIVRLTADVYERDPRVRRACIEHHGDACAVCGLRMSEAYSSVREGFCHVHHLEPLSEAGGEHEVDPIVDLRPVCPNCHAAIHARVPALSIEEAQAAMRSRRAGTVGAREADTAASES